MRMPTPLLLGIAAMTANAHGQGTYKLPPREVVAILDAPPPSLTIPSPKGDFLAVLTPRGYPPIAELARPIHRLAGVRIDTARGARQRGATASALYFKRSTDGIRFPTHLPADMDIDTASFQWSPDGKRFAFARSADDGIELWTGHVYAQTAGPVPGVRLVDVLTGVSSVRWADNDHILATVVPADRGPAPQAPKAPSGPNIEESGGKVSALPTYQDLLKSPRDEALLSYYGRSQVAKVDVATGNVQRLGSPALYTMVDPSPDSRYLLVASIKPPFSYRVTYADFARTIEVRDAANRPVRVVADLPVADDTPRQGVAKGARRAQWQPLRPATVVWAEALDGGDPLVKVPHRDRLLALSTPFEGTPREVAKLKHRFTSLGWLATPGRAVLEEYDRDRRWSTSTIVDLDDSTVAPKVLFDLSAQDAYADPGDFVLDHRPDGQSVILQDGDAAYLVGRGASADGDRPFLDRIDLKTLSKSRLFRSEGGIYEMPRCFIGDSRTLVLTSRESPKEPRNAYALDMIAGTRTALTTDADPAPQLAGIKKERLTYARPDGVPLSGTLYLPPGYKAGTKLPLLIWAYPLEYSDAATAGQVRGSTSTFTRLAGDSPLFFLTQGYAVLMDATMPVVGDPESMNDTYVEQIVAAAKAAIDAVDAKGVVDRNRVVVAGHSYGAFMTANLLAHCDLFAAGIARSGAYNRSLTPFGFQGERRSYWEANELYQKMSPFNYADKIKTPILFIHGEADNNTGTFPIQSERMFQAVKGHAGTARLVMLPHESHVYRGRESVLHVLAEMIEWADRHAKDRPTAEAK